MDALKRCDRAPPAARARGRSRGHAVTCVLPSFESCRNPPGPGPDAVWLEGRSTRNRSLISAGPAREPVGALLAPAKTRTRFI